jgi:uncharacterized protein YukJ
MPLGRYGVLRGEVAGMYREWGDDRPHYQIHVLAAGTHYRVAVNVQYRQAPSELLYLVEDDFRHPLVDKLPSLKRGFTRLRPRRGVALDYVRGDLVRREDMRLLPGNLAGPDNDLSDLIARYAHRARRDSQAELYAFGEPWGPEAHADRIFDFKPGNGMHNIHMNQGNIPAYKDDDGVWQDGALFFHFPAQEQWVTIFLAFQSQSWHTDDRTGHAQRRGTSRDE